MRKSTITDYILLAGCMMALAAGCKSDYVLPKEIDPGIQISFSNDLVPIFNQSCNMSGCHNASGPPPDLRPATAYEALFKGNYIDTLTPENSELYQWMAGNRRIPMPIEGANATYNSKVLLWIQQGAKNN